MKRIAVSIMLLCAWLCLAQGCGTTHEMTVDDPAGYRLMKRGRTAVLNARAPGQGQSKAAYMIWGHVVNANCEMLFAEKLADVARGHAGLDVIRPAEAIRTLGEESFDLCAEPDRDALDQAAARLSCATYLTARVDRWSSTYILLYQHATIQFALSAFQPGVDEPLWQAEVRYVERNVDDQTLAARALRDVFRRLEEGDRGRSVRTTRDGGHLL